MRRAGRIGLGLLEAIPEKEILANVDTDDANKDGISCKPNWVWSKEENKVMLGRFGWKAGVPPSASRRQRLRPATSAFPPR